MVGAVAGRAVAVTVKGVVAWQKASERTLQVCLRTGTSLDYREAGSRVRNEDVE
jgi:hypothetical protein